MTFLDEAVIFVTSGSGGDGAATFHREKHVPRGGPNGSDGGRGGDVLFVADHSKRTLYDFRFHAKFQGENGQNAVGNKRGRDGKGVVVKVPIGTIVTDEETGTVLADLAHDGATFLAGRGGKGGFGNLHYVSSVRQVPQFAQRGEPGEQRKLKLELKLLADIGLVGMPNAGKSTLISSISAAKPKIADYPFTTLAPELGVVSAGDETFVVADLPGLIEGASEGHGLGHQFLKHVERTRVIVHVVDGFPYESEDPRQNFDVIEAELKAYSESVWSRPRLIALNKCDLADEDAIAALEQKFADTGVPVFAISAATGFGLERLRFGMLETLKVSPEPQGVVVVGLDQGTDEPDTWKIEMADEVYVLSGRKLVRMVAMTNLDNEHALRHLHRSLTKMGVIDKLREMGASEGDTVQIGDLEFAFTDEL